MRSSDGEKQTQ